MLNIAIDAMGGDKGPDISIPGTLKALRKNPDIQVTIFGNKERIKEILSKAKLDASFDARINIFHTNDEENIPMGVKDLGNLRSDYPQSSMFLAIKHIKKGESDALVSAGNTGALGSLSARTFGRIKGIGTMALAAKLPDKNGGEDTLFLDAGANKEPNAKNILKNAIMGALYIKNTIGIEKPKIGLLNIGAESNKGRKIDVEAFALLEESDLFDFMGNIESNKLLDNPYNIVVTDGFTGNQVLKMGEGTKEAIIYMIKSKIDKKAKKLRIPKSIRTVILNMIDKLFISTDGGAVLLGINKPVVKAHGGSSVEAFANAILIAYKYAEGNVIEGIKSEIEKMKLIEEI